MTLITSNQNPGVGGPLGGPHKSALLNLNLLSSHLIHRQTESRKLGVHSWLTNKE